jgi:hypothetical protein
MDQDAPCDVSEDERHPKGVAMDTKEIPRREWPGFFEGFSRRHQGWLATLRVLDDRLGAQTEARELPLEGIVADDDKISIHLGERPDRHIAHPVARPERVWIEVEEGGAEYAVEVESDSGTRTILEFRAIALPETVDGIAGSPEPQS